MLDSEDRPPGLRSGSLPTPRDAEKMNSPTCVTNEELASVPPTLIVKFLLYCNMAIMGIALLLLAALRANTGRFLVLALASGVLVWLMYFCISSINKLREYAYILASEKVSKCAAVN